MLFLFSNKKHEKILKKVSHSYECDTFLIGMRHKS